MYTAYHFTVTKYCHGPFTKKVRHQQLRFAIWGFVVLTAAISVTVSHDQGGEVHGLASCLVILDSVMDVDDISINTCVHSDNN